MLLIAALVVHLQCGGSCLAETLNSQTAGASSSVEPPCHEHQQPTDSPQQNHDRFNSCSQGPLIEAKGGASGKGMLNVAAISPLFSLRVNIREPFTALVIVNPPGNVVSTFATSVLRI